MKNFIVYKITNIINGKVYFGVTKTSIEKRWIQHKCNSTRKNYHLYKAILKYGIESFIIKVVKLCDTEIQMYNLEIKLIKKHKSNNPLYGYNNSIGGEVSSKGTQRTDEQKKRISDYQKMRVRKPYSKETIEKMRLSAKGRDMSRQVELSALKRRGCPAHNRVKIFSIDSLGIIKEYESLTDAYKKTGISVTSISNNLKNKSKKAGGLKWNYRHEN